ncbi:MAG TPA: SPOR domain-containing protein [Thermoanaerobaculia bacterium]
MAGVIIQSVKSSNAYELALIESERVKLAQEKAESAKTRLEGQSAQLEKHRMQLLGQVAQFEGQLRGLEVRYRSESEKAKLIAQTEEAVGSLEALKVAVGERSVLPAFAVVASFRSLERAKEHAKSLASIDRTYQVVVFRRAPQRYPVTLGGYLSYEEAANRVQHANNLA